jgi:hypothetical protein
MQRFSKGRMMDVWQIVLVAVFVGTPFLLLGVFHASRERLSSRGKPLSRVWRPAVPPVAPDEDHHH